MVDTPNPKALLSPADLKVVESVLGTNSSYVLDFFSDYTLNQFIMREVNVDATAAHFAVGFDSKASRLYAVLHSLPGPQQAKLLRALLRHMENPVRASRVGKLDANLRQRFEDVVHSLEQHVEDTNNYYSASAWTGRRTLREQVKIVQDLAPIAQREIDFLASLIESQQFNDPIAADTVQVLREMHQQLGELLSAVDRGALTREAVEALEAKRQAFVGMLKRGARVFGVAPTMTLGLTHLLAFINNAAVDTTLIAGVFGGVVALDIASQRKR